MNRSHGCSTRLIPILIGLCLLSRAHQAIAAHSGTPDADSLFRRALGHLAQGTHDERRLALRDLDDAARIAGERTDILHAVAWTYSAMGHFHEARSSLDRITRLTPGDARAQRGLGQLWKWEWLASVEPS